MSAVKSKILDQKDARDILFPTGKIWEFGGKTYEIYPLPDEALSKVSDHLQTITDLFRELLELRQATSAPDAKPEELFQAADMLPLIPSLVKTLLPSQSALIAAAIQEPVEWVSKAIPLARKLECLRLIIEAEDVPLIVQNFLLLASAFKFPSVPMDGSGGPAPVNPVLN